MTKVTVHKDAQADTPSQSIIKAANQPSIITDGKGRTIGIKNMKPLDRLRFFEVIGPENSKNEVYVGYAALAFMVTSIDGEAVTRPSNKIQLESLVQRLDDAGMDAIAAHLQAQAKAAEETDEAALKNGSSTPS